MQTTARRNGWPLDKTVIVTEVTKRTPEQVQCCLTFMHLKQGCKPYQTLYVKGGKP